MARTTKKAYNFNSLAGCVTQKKSRMTGTLVGVYNSEQSGLEDDPSCAWMTVCEKHHVLVGHPSLRLALDHSSHPEEWCEDCEARHYMYVMDEESEPFTYANFLENNENLCEGDKTCIRDLAVGKTVTVGGGACAESTLRRVA